MSYQLKIDMSGGASLVRLRFHPVTDRNPAGRWGVKGRGVRVFVPCNPATGDSGRHAALSAWADKFRAQFHNQSGFMFADATARRLAWPDCDAFYAITFDEGN